MRFIDTSFWFALLNRGDRNHAAAATLAAGGIDRAVTSNGIVGETWTLVRRREGHEAAVRFIDRMAALPGLELLRVDEATEADAWRWLRRHDERPYSFVDATSFALMRRRRIREALAFDGDFSAAGFIEVRPA